MRKIIILIFLSGTTTHYSHVRVELWFLVLKRNRSYIYLQWNLLLLASKNVFHLGLIWSANVSPAQKTDIFWCWQSLHNVQSTLDINPIFSAGTRTEQLNWIFFGLVNVKKRFRFFSNKTTTTYLLHNGVSHDASH